MNNRNEAVLSAWLRLTRVICNDRIVSDLPLNESLLCNSIYRSLREDPSRPITATWLCHELKMQKSLMNRTLTSLEEKGLITRERADDDKRNIYIHLNYDHAQLYESQHERILTLVGTILDRLGNEKANDILTLFHQIADVADEIIQ